MIAFHYPPLSGGSGVQRALKFSRYLPEYGWQPIVLSAGAKAYPQTGDDLIHDVPAGIDVRRTFALDTARHLSIWGSYLNWMALPDRWISWWLGAVPVGLRLIRAYRPDAIFSTYPIATAHLIGLTLHRLTGIPWVADFRDSMTEDNYPPEAVTRRCCRWIENRVVRYSSRLIFTAPLAIKMYLDRYPSLSSEKCLLISNGYDEEDFEDLVFLKPGRSLNPHSIRLIHAGLIYPEERDPRPFFRALAQLKSKGAVSAKNLRVELRASGSAEYFGQIIRGLNIADLVHLIPALPYRESLQDCAYADGLLLFQAASCNHQIPAKVYEYLRLQRPILALTDKFGDTAALLNETGGGIVVDPTDDGLIAVALINFLSTIRDGASPVAEIRQIERYTRRNQTSDLANRLLDVVKSHSSA
jgi:glycosyltransferase involved in cell wall biosynthesis